MQPRFGQEIQLDKIATTLGIDPAELRLRICEEPNTTTANWLRVGTIGLAECVRRVVERSDWKNKYGKLPEGRGVGIACSSYLCGAGLPIYWNKMPHSGVQLNVDRGGRAAVLCGETDIGQGSDTVLATCVAEVLGIQLDDVRIHVADTGLTPVDLGRAFFSFWDVDTGQPTFAGSDIQIEAMQMGPQAIRAFTHSTTEIIENPS